MKRGRHPATGCTRREFCRWVAGGVATAGLPLSLAACGSDEGWLAGVGEQPPPRHFRFAVLADTHIIDDFYEGPEGNELDTETIFKTRERLLAARDALGRVDPPIEMGFVCGDFFHNYPSSDWDFYFRNTTRIDIAKELVDGFAAPIYPGFGNHDYDVPSVSRAFSHDLFREKLGVEPYYKVEFRGWSFLHVNNFLGETWNPASPDYDRGIGSLGETQLNWLEAELDRGRPTFLFLHYPLAIVKAREVGDYGLYALLRRFRDTIRLVVSGHTHLWIPLGELFGPDHIIMASTRYDEDAYMVVEVDTVEERYEVLNWDRVRLFTHYSEPYP